MPISGAREYAESVAARLREGSMDSSRAANSVEHIANQLREWEQKPEVTMSDEAKDRLQSFCQELAQRLDAHDHLQYDEGQSRLPGEDRASAKLFFIKGKGYQWWTLEIPGDAGEMKLAGSGVNSTEYDFRNGYNVGFFGGSGGYVADSEQEDPEAASQSINDAGDAADRVMKGITRFLGLTD